MKIKILFLIFSLIISLCAFTQEVTDCSNAFNKLGDGSGNDQIPTYCIEEIQQFENEDLKASFKSESKELVFSAYMNAIIMEDKLNDRVHVTSGTSTLLKNISKI
mgnify:CR=1 FL=1